MTDAEAVAIDDMPAPEATDTSVGPGAAEPEHPTEPDPIETVSAGAATTDAGAADAGPAGRIAPPSEQLPMLIEAMLFVSEEPVEPGILARALGVSTATLGTALNALQVSLHGRGIRLQRGPAGVQLITAPEASRAVEEYLGLEVGRRLSNAALETLAIIAYRQPVTRAQIDSIRGVSSEGAVSTLRARGLIDEVGRSEAPGRPVLFATTQRFLEHFGIERPEDLPPLPDDIAQIPDRQLPLTPPAVTHPATDAADDPAGLRERELSSDEARIEIIGASEAKRDHPEDATA